MGKRLSDIQVDRIIKLHRRGSSYPKIAARLKINKETVGRYIRKLKQRTRVVSIALYRKDFIKIKHRAKKEKKSVSDIVREIVNSHLS